MNNSPFSSKYISEGKLTKRKKGYSFDVLASQISTIEIPIDFDCKVDVVEIINCDIGDSVNFKVLDDDTGSISGIAKSVLNQYGYDVKMTDKFYREQNKYQADLNKGMYLLFEFSENANKNKTIYINIDFHEVKNDIS